MSDRASLTGRYLDTVTRRGAGQRELIGPLPGSDLLNALYRGRFLSRPVFTGAAERAALHADLDNIRTALASLPGRRFGGDLAAFARAAGLTGVQADAVQRSRSTTVTALTRADLYTDGDGFRLLELNMGSAIGGIDNADLCRGLLAHPVLAGFAAEHGLGYVDTMAEQVATIFAETGAEPGSVPVIALADWPGHYAAFSPYLHKLAVRWRALGLDARPCHVGELEAGRGPVRLRGERVDIIFRLFLIEHLLEPDGPALIGPVLAAAERGAVAMFTPLDTELYGSKAALAMLGDEQGRALCTASERASLDRILPWTRLVAPGPARLPGGGQGDLIEYAVTAQRDLVLKPALLGGGRGVVLGDSPGCGPAQWRDQLAAAAREPYVIQQRIRPEPELFPGPDGALVPWVVTWGPFTLGCGFGGIYTRAVPAASPAGAINRHSGAHVGSGLSAGLSAA
ncbi:MAG TPA: hypothetical protein VH637_10075 [Streptosporangiaceae bacterium]|jgi:hypothetical protein